MLVLGESLESINPVFYWKESLFVRVNFGKELLLEHICQVETPQGIVLVNKYNEFLQVNLIRLSSCIIERFLQAIVNLWNFKSNLLNGGELPINGARHIQATTHWSSKNTLCFSWGSSNIGTDIINESLKVGWLNLFSFVETENSEQPIHTRI